MTVLVIAEHEDGAINGATLAAVAAAQQIGADVHMLVAGSDCSAASDAAAKVAGVSTVRVADDATYAHGLGESMADLVVSLAGDYSHIFAAHTTVGRNILPRAAALLDVAPIADIQAVVDAETFERPIYAGNAIATVKSADATKLITVRGTAFEAVAAEGGSASVESVSAAAGTDLATFVSQELSESERPELTSARVVVSGGRGMGSGENFAILEPVADKLNAAIGASRAAVDAGFVPNEYQVGQTGKVVAPDLYVAVGISGAIQHLAGMKDSKVIVAVNKDEEAPIFQVADYGLVADLFKAVPEIDEELGKQL
jgi:electron transfer flavoprotein alpha subunit